MQSLEMPNIEAGKALQRKRTLIIRVNIMHIHTFLGVLKIKEKSENFLVEMLYEEVKAKLSPVGRNISSRDENITSTQFSFQF